MIDYTLPLDRLPDPLPIEPLTKPFDVTITPPGSKSITCRAYILAALAEGESQIIRPLRADDTDLLLKALCTLGAEARWEGDNVHINGVGGRLGPDLSDIGWLRSTRHLKSSIIDPDLDIDRRYLSLHILKKDGQAIQGVPLNEDSYSIQLMDLQENLHSLWKRDLEELRQEERSWMPSYQGTFSESELDDLVSYLYSLRRKTE